MNKKEIVKNNIINKIIGSQLNIGDKIDTERSMAQELNISRSSVRKALQELVFSDWLESRPGSGYYVAGFGSYEVLFSKGRYKINKTKIGDITIEDKQMVKKYFEDIDVDKNKIFHKKYLNDNDEVKIYTINVVNKDFSFYLDDDEIENGFIQALANHQIKISYQKREVVIHESKNNMATSLGWKSIFPIILSTLVFNDMIIERSIIIMSKEIFNFSKKITF